MNKSSLYPWLDRRDQNFVDEYDPGRMCYVLEIDNDIYFSNYIKDTIEKDSWFADIENNLVFKAKENSTETARRIVATTNCVMWKEEIHKIPSGFTKEKAHFVFLEYDPWVDTWTEERKRQYPYTLKTNKASEIIILKVIKSKTGLMKIITKEEIERINKESDEKSWKTVAAMLFNICKATYGEDFENWIEAKHYNKMEDLAAKPF